MATRRIPISSSSTNSRQASQPVEQPTRYASSLDAVFSFQRSAAFFQDNLQSGPSFVDREHYPRPFDDDDDDEEGEDDAARYGGGDEDETSESLDQDERVGETSASSPRDAAVARAQQSALGGSSGVTGDDSQDSDSGPPSGLLVDTATTTSAGHDALPPNAVARYSRSGQQRRRAGEETTEEATEQSPLLARPRTRSRSRHNRNGDMFQIGGDTTTTSSDYLSTKAGDSSGLYSHGHAGSRRASVFSREVWKAKIEAHRGESTWGQTLFNT